MLASLGRQRPAFPQGTGWRVTLSRVAGPSQWFATTLRTRRGARPVDVREGCARAIFQPMHQS
jgi:hypothetical protein